MRAYVVTIKVTQRLYLCCHRRCCSHLPSNFHLEGSVGEKEVAASFLAMVGTFLGALFAFRLNENKENMKVEEERKAALNRALFVVARQINALKSLSKHLAPFHTEFERAFNLPAVRPLPIPILCLTFKIWISSWR